VVEVASGVGVVVGRYCSPSKYEDTSVTGLICSDPFIGPYQSPMPVLTEPRECEFGAAVTEVIVTGAGSAVVITLSEKYRLERRWKIPLSKRFRN